ncbi:MAG: RNA polymerase sigma factor, partial [Acidimicrobiales bacterium]
MAGRVSRILRRRGAPPDTIDDALQTAAMRALKRSEGFDSPDGLVNWLVKVAWHEIQAEWRRHARLETGPVPERSGPPDPADVVEDRLALDAVADGLASLSDAEREAILGGVDRSGDSPASTKMRRYRARKHLAAIVAATKTGT